MTISFKVIDEIVKSVRQSKVTGSTHRQILQQLDTAIDRYDVPQETIVFDRDQSSLKRREYLCSELEELKNNHRVEAEMDTLPIAAGQRAVMLLTSLYENISGSSSEYDEESSSS